MRSMTLQNNASMKKYIHINRLLSIVLLLGIFCLSINTYGQYYEFSAMQANASAIDQAIAGTANAVVLDIEDPDAGQTGFESRNPGVLLTARFDTDAPPFAHITYVLTVSITPRLEDGTLDNSLTYEYDFKIENNPHIDAGTFQDTEAHRIEGAYGAQVIPIAFEGANQDTNTNLNSTPANVILWGSFQVERYYDIASNAPNVNAPQIINTTASSGSSAPGSILFSWSPVAGAMEYELEYSWVDNYAPIDPNTGTIPDPLPANQIPFSTRDFELNNTRIQTLSTSYEFPLIYSQGYLIYRVRAVARHLSNFNQPVYTAWSSTGLEDGMISDWTQAHIAITPHENDMNWQFQASFAEEGKKKEVVSYFDGTLRNRQTVTKINSDDNAIVGEVIYDNQGRPAIEVLPTPVAATEDNEIRYYSDYNKNSLDSIYTHNDFDWSSTDSTAVDCETPVGLMNTSSGASAYYGNQSLEPGTFQDFVSNAEGFPFSQIEYTPDNTGRIRRKGGVGPTHQLGTNHEMKYYYAVPTQEELNRLFGYRVGNAQHYKKNMVVDPNGQVSISYIDPQGRTIATALAGDSPVQLEGLQDEDGDTGLHNNVTVDILNKLNPTATDSFEDNNERYSTGNYGVLQDGLRVARQLVVTSDGTALGFDYSASLDNSFDPEHQNEACDDLYPFVFKYSCTILDDCGNAILGPFNFPAGSASTAGNHIPVNFVPPHSETGALPAGTYTADKRLTVDEDVLNEYAQHYRNKLQDSLSVCFIDPSPYAPDVTLALCDIVDCDDCATAVGDLDSYIENGLSEFFGIATTTFTVTISGDTINVTGLAGQLDFDGEPITDEEIDLLVIRFETEHILLIDGCLAGCDQLELVPASCEVSTIQLLQDVSPVGQYGTIEIAEGETEITDLLSVFNETNLLGENANWRNPIPNYIDEFGNEARIPIVEIEEGLFSPEIIGPPMGSFEGGDLYVLPQHLAHIADFLNYWQPSWANALLPYHPESCYLDYAEAICNHEATVNIYNPENGSNTATTIHSDAYDSYISGITTYADAIAAAEALIGSDTEIMDNDPYFQNSALDNVETIAIRNLRFNIMEEALLSNYEGLTEDGSENGPSMDMLQAAYITATCNGLETCIPLSVPQIIEDLNDGTLSVTQQNALWNTYKGNYRSVKEKIKTVFQNIYALEQGCYNGCIGGDDDGAITTVLAAYSISDIVDYIDAIPSLEQPCDDEAYNEAVADRQKRFLPVDTGYDSGIDPEDAIEELGNDADYVTWVQTGNCPLAIDLQFFLQSYFGEVNGSGLRANPSTNLTPYMGNYLVPDLFEALGGGTPELQAIINGASLTVNTNLGGCSNNQIVINSPYSWSNYELGQPTGNDWQITGVTNIFYDEQAATNDPANGVFAFQFVAQIITGSGSFEELVMTGTTCAAIGECSVADDGVGDVLDDQVSDPDSPVGCTRQTQFEEDFVAMLNALKNDEQLEPDPPFSLSTYDPYTNSFLPEFFEDDSANPIVIWDYEGGNYILTINGNEALRMEVPSLASVVAVESIHFESTNLTGQDDLEIYYTNTSGQLDSYVAHFTPGLNYSCCDNEIVTNNEPHIGFAFIAPNSSGLTNTHRLNIGEGITQFVNNNVNDTFYATSYDVANDGPRIRAEQFNFNNNPIIDIAVNCCSEIRGFVSASTTEKIRIQNDFNGNSFRNINTHINNNTNLNAPIDVMYYVLTRDSYTNINDSRSSLQNLFNTNKIKKAFFIILEGANGSDIFSITGPTNLTPYQFIGELLNSTPIEYNTMLGVYNSDFIAFSASDMIQTGFESTLSQVLQDGYNSVQNGTSSPGSCETCIAQPVTPVSCTAAYAQFSDPVTGIEALVDGYNIPQSYYNETLDNPIENFCNLNYGYLVESYLYYINTLEVTSIEDNYFISLAEFGDTHLNYGYNQINDVIDAYASFPQNEQFVYWNTYVNDEYLSANQVCPPAPLPIGELTVEVPISSCNEFVITVNEAYEQDSYQAYLDQLVAQFKTDYINQAISEVVETLDMTYFDKEYQYTLYYYDQAGNLSQTVPPQGADRLDVNNATLHTAIDTHRASGQIAEEPALVPEHNLQTQYKYNSLNQLVWQQTPDGGVTRFAYDDLGRIIASQNEWQQAEFPKIDMVANTPGYLDITQDGKTITKLSGVWAKGGFYSTTLLEGDGYVERIITEDLQQSNTVSLGLSYVSRDASATTHPSTESSRPHISGVQYGMYTYSNDGNPETLRLTALQANGTGINPGRFVNSGDRLRITRTNGMIFYHLNDELLHEIEEASPGEPLRIDGAMFRVGAQAANIKLVKYGVGDLSTLDRNRYSYTTYDGIGRITEAGEITPLRDDYRITDEGRLERETEITIVDDSGNSVTFIEFQKVNDFVDFPVQRREVTQTIYDQPVSLNFPSGGVVDPITSSDQLFENFNAFTLRNRVAAVLYYNRLDNPMISHALGPRFSNAIFYDYDIHGNVKELVNFYSDLYNPQNNKHLRRVAYDYDLISGNVRQVTYQRGQDDQFIHKYDYDADNRITAVHTSRDGYIWEKDATYEYYAHGPLARMEVGDKQVQGMDYVYTLQGWLKSVNGEYVDHPTGDFGQDGLTNALVAKDAYGYSLNYYNGDYQPVVTGAANGALALSQNTSIIHSTNDLYNGNIKQMTTSLRKEGDQMLHTQVNRYTYDQLNRIKQMNSSAIIGNAIDEHNSYFSEYTYDNNGNLQTLVRDVFNEDNPTASTLVPMDNLSYTYRQGTNQLTRVSDATTNDPFTSDIEDQLTGIVYDPENTQTHNYIYDEIGQLIEDKSEHLRIEWRVDGKVDKVRKYNDDTFEKNIETTLFEYDGLGNRIIKRFLDLNSNTVTSSYYARDAQGNVLSVLEGKADAITIKNNTFSSFGSKEHHIYGSSRLGLEQHYIPLASDVTSSGSSAQDSPDNTTVLDDQGNVLTLELGQNAYLNWDAGNIDDGTSFTNINYDVRSAIVLKEPLAINDSLKVTTLAFTNSMRQSQLVGPNIVTYRDNYLDVYIKNDNGIYKPAFYGYCLMEGQPLLRLDVVSQRGVVEETILSEGLSFNFASRFNENNDTYNASLDLGDNNRYTVGNGLDFIQYIGEVQDSINLDRPSVIGGDTSSRFQIDDLYYRLTTDIGTLEDTFDFLSQANSAAISSDAGIEAAIIANTDFWRASIFNNTIIKRTFTKEVGDRRYELSNHLGNVLSVVSDKKIPNFTGGSLNYFNADVLAYNDYYAWQTRKYL